MATLLGVGTSVSNHHNQKHKQQAAGLGPGPGPHKIVRILDSLRKFFFDSIANVSSKAIKGRVPLQKTIHEELVNETLLKPCNNKDKPSIKLSEEEMQAKIEKMQEEINAVKHTTMTSSASTKPESSKKSPPEQLKEKLFVVPNKNRIMIRSRL